MCKCVHLVLWSGTKVPNPGPLKHTDRRGVLNTDSYQYIKRHKKIYDSREFTQKSINLKT